MVLLDIFIFYHGVFEMSSRKPSRKRFFARINACFGHKRIVVDVFIMIKGTAAFPSNLLGFVTAPSSGNKIFS